MLLFHPPRNEVDRDDNAEPLPLELDDELEATEDRGDEDDREGEGAWRPQEAEDRDLHATVCRNCVREAAGIAAELMA